MNIDIDKIVNDLYKNIDDDNMVYYIERFIHDDDYYKDEYEEVNASDIENLDLFKEYLKDEIRYDVKDSLSIIDKLISNNTINIYRAIRVDLTWTDDLFNNKVKDLGVYWSWDKDAAESHWGHNTSKIHNILLCGVVDVKYIDWLETISMNASPIYFQEREIRLNENSPVIINEVYFNNKLLPNDSYKGKIFYSTI